MAMHTGVGSQDFGVLLGWLGICHLGFNFGLRTDNTHQMQLAAILSPLIFINLYREIFFFKARGSHVAEKMEEWPELQQDEPRKIKNTAEGNRSFESSNDFSGISRKVRGSIELIASSCIPSKFERYSSDTNSK